MFADGGGCSASRGSRGSRRGLDLDRRARRGLDLDPLGTGTGITNSSIWDTGVDLGLRLRCCCSDACVEAGAIGCGQEPGERVVL